MPVVMVVGVHELVEELACVSVKGHVDAQGQEVIRVVAIYGLVRGDDPGADGAGEVFPL